MKKLVLLLISIILVIFNLVGCSNSKDTTYTIEKHKEIRVGKDIPSGKYTAKIINPYIFSFDISPIEYKENNLVQYGESLVGKRIKESDMNNYVYEVNLPKDKIVVSDTDIILIKK